jgi:hypothetical protein
MSGAPAAARSNSFFLCAVRWFTGQSLCAVPCASDSHCALSSVHRTCTVDCPVRPYHVLKKGLQPAPEPEANIFLCSLALSPLWRFALPRRRPPLTGDHRAPATQCSSPTLLSVSSPFSLCLSSLSVLLCRDPQSTLLCQIQIPIKVCESKLL